jgi:hypothetical protein
MKRVPALLLLVGLLWTRLAASGAELDALDVLGSPERRSGEATEGEGTSTSGPAATGAITVHPAWNHSIPLASLTREALALVSDVIGHAVLSHQVAGITYRSRKAVFEFLIERPEFAAAVAKALRVGEYRVVRTPDGYHGDDLRGARGLIRIIYSDETRRIYYLQGSYSHKLLPTINGRILIVAETRHHSSAGGESYAETELTGYLRLDSAITELLAMITRPVAEAAVDQKVKRFFRTITRVSQQAHDDPEGLYETLVRHQDLERETLQSFREALLAHRLPSWAEGRQFRLQESDSGVRPDE